MKVKGNERSETRLPERGFELLVAGDIVKRVLAVNIANLLAVFKVLPNI
jgi:hypothetical protein